MGRDERSDTELVLAARAEDPSAFGQLFDRWFDRSWNVARNILRDDDLANDMAQEALIGAWQQLDQLRDPDAFGGWLLRSTRNKALNRLARERRSTASGDEIVSGLRDRGQADPTGAEPLPEPDAVSELRDRQELVWAAAAALGESDASLLDLHLRHGLTPAEIAEELGVAANAAHQQLFRLRGRLGDAIGSYLLWRNGRPLCDGLAAAVSGGKAFDRSVARAVRRHQSSCDVCSEERASLVDPHKLFASVPLLVVPAGLKAQAAAALETAGVPMAGSTGAGSTSSDGGSPDGPSSNDTPSNDTPSNDTPSDDTPSNDASSNDAPSDGGSSNGASSNGGGTGSSGEGQLLRGYDNLARAMTSSRPSASRLSIQQLLVGAGAGVVTLAVLVGLVSLIPRGDEVSLLTGLESRTSDPDVVVGQGANGNDQDPAGPASFSGDGAPDPGTTTTAGTRPRPATTIDRTSVSSSTSSTADDTTSSSSASTSSETTATTRGTTSSASTTETTATTATTPTTPTTRETTSSSSETTGTTGTTQPPVDPPAIIRFSVSADDPSVKCPSSQSPFKATWAVQGTTTSITLDLAGASLSVAANGRHSFCAGGGVSVTLKATGPGGSDTATGST